MSRPAVCTFWSSTSSNVPVSFSPSVLNTRSACRRPPGTWKLITHAPSTAIVSPSFMVEKLISVVNDSRNLRREGGDEAEKRNDRGRRAEDVDTLPTHNGRLPVRRRIVGTPIDDLHVDGHGAPEGGEQEEGERRQSGPAEAGATPPDAGEQHGDAGERGGHHDARDDDAQRAHQSDASGDMGT